VGGRPCGGRHDEGPRMRRSCNRSACRRARRLRKLSLPPRVAVTASKALTGFAGLGYNLCKDAAAFKSKRATLTRREHGASCPREILRFSTVSSPKVEKRRGADVDFQAAWAHVSNQEHQVSPRGASDWWRESVRKSVSVHQDKSRGSAIAGT